MVDIDVLEAVNRVYTEHAVKWFHAYRGANGQWVDYASCAICKRLDDEERPELHPARKLADEGLLAVGPDRPAAAPRDGSSLL